MNEGKSTLHAVIAGSPEMPIYKKDNGDLVVRVYKSQLDKSAVSPTQSRIETMVPSTDSKVSFNIESSEDGVFGNFHVKGDVSRLMGSLAGLSAVGGGQINTDRQIGTVPPVVNRPALGIEYTPSTTVYEETETKACEKPIATDDPIKLSPESGHKRATRWTRGPRFAGAVVLLSAATAGGIYHVGSGGDNILDLSPKETISNLQADWHQLSDQPAKTIIAQFRRL